MRNVLLLYDFDTVACLVNIGGHGAVYLFLCEIFSTKFYQFFVVHFARGANQKRNLANYLLLVLEHLLVGECLDLLDVTGNGMCDAAAFEVDGVKDVAHDFFGNVVIAVDFFDNHAAFFFHFLLVHARVHEHVGNHVDSER